MVPLGPPGGTRHYTQPPNHRQPTARRRGTPSRLEGAVVQRRPGRGGAKSGPGNAGSTPGAAARPPAPPSGPPPPTARRRSGSGEAGSGRGGPGSAASPQSLSGLVRLRRAAPPPRSSTADERRPHHRRPWGPREIPVGPSGGGRERRALEGGARLEGGGAARVALGGGDPSGR
jgi:hypothetical protein